MTFLAIFSLYNLQAQDISYNRKIVDTLTSPTFWGRGYTNDGMKKAAVFLANEFKKLGLKPLDKKDTTVAVNIFYIFVGKNHKQSIEINGFIKWLHLYHENVNLKYTR